MKALVRRFPLAPTLALGMVVAAAACSRDLATNVNGTNGSNGTTGTGTGAAPRAQVAVRMAAGSATASPTGSMPGLLMGASDNGGTGGFGGFGDGAGHHWRGWWGWMRSRDVDSLIVTATKLEVLTALPDSESAADSAADSLAADSARGHDWSEREWGWVQLPIDSARLDLIHLPDSASAGIPVATGTLPAGRYRHVRLFIVNPLIYFDSTLVTPAGDTLKGGVGYPVIFPSADSTGAIFRTDDPFVVPAAGDTVSLYFDRDDTVRHIIITGDGKIIVPPIMRFGR